MNPLRPTKLVASLLAMAFAVGSLGCTTPCKKLANRLCEMSGDDGAQCERWKERTSRVPTKTCESGLRQLDRDRIR